MRQRRHPGAEIVGHALENLGGVDVLLLRRATNALEAMRDTLEPFDVAGHVTHRALPEIVPLAVAQQLDPSGKAGDRRPELMRRLSSHAGPDPLAVSAGTCLKGVPTGEEQKDEKRHLSHGNDLQSAHQSRVTEVDYLVGAESAGNDRRSEERRVGKGG